MSILYAYTLTSASSVPVITADNPITFTQAGNEMLATGNAHIAYKDIQINSHILQFSKDTNTLTATQSVIISNQNSRIATQKASYSIADNQFDIGPYDLITSTDKAYVHITGNSIQGNSQQLQAKQTRTYFYSHPVDPEPHPLDLNVTSATVNCDPKNYLEGWHNWIYIGSVPCMYIPYFRKDLNESLLNMDTSTGYSKNLGYYIKNNLTINVMPELKIGAFVDYYGSRGWLYGPEASYNFKGTDIQSYGDFSYGTIQDHNITKRGTDILGNPIKKHRDFFLWNHKQNFLEEHLQLTQSLHIWSDSEVIRDYEPRLYEKDQQPDSFSELVYTDTNTLVTGFCRYRPNQFQRIAETLPEVAFERLNTPFLETDAYYTYKGTVTVLRERSASKYNIHRGYNRLDGYYGLMQPIVLADYLTLTSITGVRLTRYSKIQPQANTHAPGITVARAQFGFDLLGKGYGLWDYQNAKWKINDLRHVVRPIIQYRYTPCGHNGGHTLPPIYYKTMRSNLESIDLGAQRNLDTLQSQNVMRLGLQNFLQTRTKTYVARNLIDLNFYQDIRIHKRYTAQDIREHHLSDFFTELELSPIYWLNFKVFKRFDWSDKRLNEINTKTKIINGDAWTAKIETSYTKHRDNQVCLGLKHRLNVRNQVKMGTTYDARLGKIIKHYYTLTSQMSNNWSVKGKITCVTRAKREPNIAFVIEFKLTDSKNLLR